MPDPLALAVAAVLARLPAPYAPSQRAEAAAEERRLFIPRTAVALVAASREATCTGDWSELECKRRWPGPPEEIATLAGILGYFESRLDARIQGGGCDAWGPSPSQIECDGILWRSGVRPPGFVGITKRTRWGLVGFRASSMFQFQGLSEHRISEVVGLGDMNLYEASRQAVQTLSGFRSTCRTGAWETCLVSAYAGTITYSAAPVRVAMYRKVLAQVRVELARAPAG